MNSDFKLEPTPAEKAAADKAAAAADTKLGNPNLTPAERDAKPSNELKIVGSMEDLNNRDKLSNTSELNLGGKQPSDLLKEKPNANIKTGAKQPEQTKTSDPIIFQTAIGDKIPDALTNMMLMSKAVSDDMTNIDNSDPSNPRTYTPRISSSISVDPNTKERTVTFYIEKFAKPMKPDTSTGTSTEGSSTPGIGTATDQPAQSQSQAEDFSKLPEILEFDYIYTGVNVDVIQLDMNLKLAFSSLKAIQVVHPTATNNNQDLTADNAAATDKKANENAGEARDVPTTRIKSNGADDTTKNDHVGPTVSDPMRIGSGSLSPETLFAGRKNLSDQISTMLSTTTSVMKIVGNPLLLAGYVLPYDTYDDATPQSIKANKDAHRDKTGADSSGLLKVRVNIRTPKPSYMQGKPAVPDDNFYSSPFWMDKNYFYLKKITNKFTKGEFVQLLELTTIPANSNTKGGDIPAKNPRTPTTVSKPAGESINETQGANVKAFLDMISHAEGTYGKGDNGYNVRYGGTLFEGYATHPWHVKPWGKGGTPHTPAGRYQIIVGTFDSNKASCGGDFSPSSQDRIAVAIMKSVRGSYSDVVKGDPKTAINKLKATTWTGLQGFSEATLLKWYEQHGGTYKPQTSDELPSNATPSSSNTPASSTQVPSGSRSSQGIKGVNDSLVSGTQAAQNKGVKFELGSRDPNSGTVDCSGWVLANNKAAAEKSNDPNVKDGYNLMNKGYTAAGIIQTVGKASGQELSGSEVNVNNLKPGMVIGIDYGTGTSRYKGISHIAQVVQDPNTGKLQISQSGASGVKLQDADKWLDYRKSHPMYAVDPYYKTR